MAQEFDPWLYINLISYLKTLKSRDEADMNGIESVVSRKTKVGETSWIPTQPSLVLGQYTKPTQQKMRKD